MADATMNKVLYNIDQRPFTTEAQRETARNNIGAAPAGAFQVRAGNGILVGPNNTMSNNSSGCYSMNTSLATGSANTVYAQRSIVGGHDNQVNNSNRDSLVVGWGNRPLTTIDSVIAGENNWTNQVFYSVIAGEAGRISGSRSSLIMGSGFNGGNIYNSMVACDGLEIDGTLNDSVVLGGFNHFSGTLNRNYVNGTNNCLTQEPVESYARSCDYNVVNGNDNSVYNTNKVIVNGAHNYVSGDSYEQTDGAIYTGDLNIGKNVRMSVVAGQQISAEGSFRSIFIGEGHSISGANNSLVVGQDIYVNGCENATVIGSASSAINSYRSVVIGKENTVSCNDSVALGNGLEVETDETIRIGFGGQDTNCYLHITKNGISAVKDGVATPIVYEQ